MADTKAGDDYYDPESGYRIIWGDSCVSSAAAKAKLRLLVSATWTATGSDNCFISRGALSASGEGHMWSLSAIDGMSAIAGYTRPGIHPVEDINLEKYAMFFVHADGLRIQEFEYRPETDTIAWDVATAAASVGDYTGAAVHPISESECIVVTYEAPYIAVEHMSYSIGSWAASAGKHYVHMSKEDELRWSDAYWSDAVLNPADSNEIVVVLNLSRWGSAQVITKNKTSGIWSQPKEMFPSQEQWGNMKCVCSGLSVINDRIWAVTVREPWASGDTIMAHHVALMSSPDGRHWRDEDFVTISTMRGKLLYASDEVYCFLVGNSAVARAEATSKLGYDADAQKYELDEVYEVTHNVSGPSSAPEITARAKNVDNEIVDSGLLEAGNEIDIDLGTDANPFGDIAKGTVVKQYRERSFVEDEIGIQASGMMNKLVGANAYRPPAAKVFDGPYCVNSEFTFKETGNPRLTVRAETGRWTAPKIVQLGRQVLYCERAGISLLPHSFQHQAFVARTAFMPLVSLEGTYFVFWYEDEDNYWQAGVYRTSAVALSLEIRRMKDGVLGDSRVAMDAAGLAAMSGLEVGNWYTMYLDVRPGRIHLYCNGSDSYDFSSTAATITDTPFLLAGDSGVTEFGDLQEYHIGLKVDGFEDWEGAEITGTVTEAEYGYIEDSSKSFADSVRGKWVLCQDQSRQISYNGTIRLHVTPSWSVVPEVGSEYGVYPASAKDGPQAYFKELFVCEAVVPYTVDDVMNNMLELSGVSVTNAFSGTGIGPTGESSLMHDVDVKIASTTSPTYLSFWGSTDAIAGEAATSSVLLDMSRDYVDMIAVESLSSETEPYQTLTSQAKHPSMLAIPSGAKNLRVQATHKFVIVSCDGHFVTAFPAWGYWTGGYVGKVENAHEASTATTTEFPTVLDSFAWDANEPAGGALSRLLRGRRAKIVERADGTVSVSKFDVPLGQAGVYDVPITRRMEGEDSMQLVSLIEMVGADDRAFYIDMDAARKRLRYIRTDNPTLETQFDALLEAVKLTGVAVQRFGAGQAMLYVPDPALELEAEFTDIDGNRYIVDGYSFGVSTRDGVPNVNARITARGYPEGIVVAKYDDDDNYDYGGEYS